jgi:class 3 adenylate cyclase
VVIRQPGRTPIHLSVREPIEIGRECSGLLVDDPLVSRRHLELADVEGNVIVTDLGSSNGTTMDGAPIAVPMPLRPGSVVGLGEITIELVPAAPERPPTVRATVLGAAADLRATTGPGPSLGAPPLAPPVSTAGPPAEVRVRPVGGGAGAERSTSIEALASTMTSDDVRAAQGSADQGTVTIVFSDIESSTRRIVELGDQAWLDVLGLHNRIVRSHLGRFNGTEIKNQGDGFMLSFPGARLALQCMIAVQQELAAHERTDPARAVRIRVGVHTGEVLVEEGDLFGTHVVIAARVANLADGGEILVSALTREIVAARGDVVFGEPRVVDLKGIGTQTVHPVDWSRQLA